MLRPRLVIFDLDDTLAPSKSRVPDPIAERLAVLLRSVPVCVISGGQYKQFREQLLDALPTSADLSRLHLMPTNGTQYYWWTGSVWTRVYSFDLDAGTKSAVVEVLEQGARELGLWETKTWGQAIEDRGTQITYSALGQEAPVDAKREWDPEGAKRESLRAYAQDRLPELEVRAGGSTSIDVTSRGVDKAFGVGQLERLLHIDISEMVFVGDRLEPGGNDYSVKELGVPCLAVSGWEETPQVIDDLLGLFLQC